MASSTIILLDHREYNDFWGCDLVADVQEVLTLGDEVELVWVNSKRRIRMEFGLRGRCVSA